jgi:hypothetical protein
MDPKNAECMRITLFFDNKANMFSWVAEPVHEKLVTALDKYRIAPWEAKHIDHDAKEACEHVIYQDGRGIQATPITYIAPKKS